MQDTVDLNNTCKGATEMDAIVSALLGQHSDLHHGVGDTGANPTGGADDTRETIGLPRKEALKEQILQTQLLVEKMTNFPCT